MACESEHTRLGRCLALWFKRVLTVVVFASMHCSTEVAGVCVSDGDCAVGKFCSAGRCRTCSNDQQEDCECAADEDCSGSLYCVSRECVACRDESDCGALEDCVAGVCTEVSECSGDGAGECPGGEVCVDQACVECALSANCGIGQECRDNVCVDSPECSADDDCSGTLVCESQSCVECRTQEDCGEGQECSGNVCVAIAGECVADEDCGAGVCEAQRCLDCRSSADCETDQRCEAGLCVPGSQAWDLDVPFEQWAQLVAARRAAGFRLSFIDCFARGNAVYLNFAWRSGGGAHHLFGAVIDGDELMSFLAAEGVTPVQIDSLVRPNNELGYALVTSDDTRVATNYLLGGSQEEWDLFLEEATGLQIVSLSVATIAGERHFTATAQAGSSTLQQLSVVKQADLGAALDSADARGFTLNYATVELVDGLPEYTLVLAEGGGLFVATSLQTADQLTTAIHDYYDEYGLVIKTLYSVREANGEVLFGALLRSE